MTHDTMTHAAIRPFRVDIPEEDLDDLRRRIAATRWPSKELVEDRSQGVQLATLHELARYWTTDYDFGRVAARLNALTQFTTEIDGVEIHFIHVRSRHENALPLIMTHGWPGSVIELLEVVGPLTDPTAHGGRAEDAFDLVLPSLPGYGFSGEPTELGWYPGRIAPAWAELMHRLGYTRYVAQGGDVGAAVTDTMARQAPQGLIGIHTNLLAPALANAAALSGAEPSEEERAALDALATFRATGFGYFLEQATRPQTIGYALLDSPVALAAWMLDHDTDSYEKISRAFVDGQPAGNLTRDHIVDNVTVYWLTGTGVSAAREYWESGQAQARAAGKAPPPVSIPVGFTTFPGEIFRAPRSWIEKAYPNVIYFNEVDKGGHFAAWEEPELFTAEVRAAFRSLRDESPMSDDTGSTDLASGAATSSVPPGRRGLIRSIVHRLAGEEVALPVEGRLASFEGATGWVNSDPLTPEGLRGRVVLVDFSTYTCVNWLRTLPYLRAWAVKYRDDGLTVIGVHTPEFDFEGNIDNVITQLRRLGVEYPIAVDSDYAVWSAFANHFWPALYIADEEGRIRFHHFGEGEYPMTEMVTQQLLRDAGANGVDQDLVMVEPHGLEVAADWRTLQSPETYVGYLQSTGFAQEGVASFDEPHVYTLPGRLPLNAWGLSGNWTATGHAAVLSEPGGRIAFQFHARDLNLVMGPTSHGASIPFRVFLDGQLAKDERGSDVDPDGSGMVSDRGTYQLIRQPGAIADRLFEVEFLDAGVEAYCFTFG